MRVTPSDDLPVGEWMRRRVLRPAGDMLAALPRLALTDGLPMPVWTAVREEQRQGAGAEPVARNVSATAAPATAERSRLTGRPGTAAVVADALNKVAAGPGGRATIEGDGYRGELRQGAAGQVSASGQVRILGRMTPRLTASGLLEPPTGKPEVAISGIKDPKILGKTIVDLPERVRFYTTPSGELRVDLSGPITLPLRKEPLVPGGTRTIR